MGHISHALVSDIFLAALRAVNPYESVKLYINRIYSSYHAGNYRKIIVIGFGKAACSMAKAIDDSMGNMIDAGVIITKYAHCKDSLGKFVVYEAGHPVPDDNGLRGTEEVIKLLNGSDEDTLVVCLISGGGSSLLVSPYEGVTLEEKQEMTQLLLNSGATINELNTIRKHISKVKGGRLAEHAYPAKIISLILSDVIGDILDVIASGPTSPDTTTYDDALRVLEKYGLTDSSPQSILEILYNGAHGLIPETPKKGNMNFEKVEHIIIGSNRKALGAAKMKAESIGFQTEIISSELLGEAKDVGKWLAKRALDIKNKQKADIQLCLISGGETTVTVRGKGIGGRNMELALSFAKEIAGIYGITLLSAGTDGTDGPTDAAGAIVDGDTVTKAKTIGLNPEEYLNNNDSYNFFKKINGLFITGPTGTNVMDIQIMLIG